MGMILRFSRATLKIVCSPITVAVVVVQISQTSIPVPVHWTSCLKHTRQLSTYLEEWYPR